MMNFLEILPHIIELLFFLFLLSYYFLLFIPSKKPSHKKDWKITVVIPARNEEKYIAETIKSVLEASGTKEIIVVDDASTDKTYELAKKFPVKILRNKNHSGKAASLNLGIAKAKGDLIAVVDADSIIHKDALVNSLGYFDKETAGVTTIVRVKNRKKFLGMWLHIEQLYNSLLRTFFSKINANIITPGPLSIYKKKDLELVGGFEKKGYSEDVDIAVKLLRAGKRIRVSERSIAETNMPVSFKGFIRQRVRFTKGWIHIFKRHLKLSFSIIDIYSLPMALFWYIQAVIMSVFILSQIISGYITYFYSNGILFNIYALKFIIDWFSIVGTVNWVYSILIGQISLTLFTTISLFATLLSYPLYFIAIFRYDGKLDIYHLIPLLFMFPYWFLIMIIYVLNVGEWVSNYKLNKWEKVN